MRDAEKVLLIKYFNGLCNLEEKKSAQELLHADEAREFFLELCLEEWDEPLQESNNTKNTHALWKEKVRVQIHSKGEKPKKDRLPILRYAAMWAGIVLISTLALWQWQANNRSIQAEVSLIEKTNLQGTPVSYFLPDSSEVFLAGGSSVIYPQNFKGATREVKLEGEAFFQVTSDPDKPFIIHTGDISTQVLGTSFKISAFEKEDIKVEVATGKVSVYKMNDNAKQKLGILTAGLRLKYNHETGTVEQGTVAGTDLQQWTKGELIFDDEPLGSVARELERRYGVQIVCLDAKTSAYRVSTSFSQEAGVEQILRMLSKMGKFSFRKKTESNYELYKTK
ncbi:FecR family protein [Sphingobacterium haloxyli]|uniref:Anti-sigma factor n=1 Tax=Sphingobacterium haloxyli TaxID=2100533 RepID=A0A2S9J4V1_9SPHI|nr:FecR domain-containing protein [Sphingobacterium haloxyli]PRD47784.1 hypothetical protein C5745_07665 [Sphingobacterium haloxyli]